MKKIVVVIMLVLSLFFTACSKQEENVIQNDKESENISNNVEENKDKKENNVSGIEHSMCTEDYPKEKRNINYYWNIYTPNFDKSKHNGKISVFGNVVEGKLTGKTLLDNGFEFVSLSSDDEDYRIIEQLRYVRYEDKDGHYCTEDVKLLKDGKVYPRDSYSPIIHLTNINESTNLHEDATEVYFTQTTVAQDTENIIVPYMEGVNLDTISIDDLIDSLGVPTYVGGRAASLENTPDSLGSKVFVYVYAYDDYIFKFKFVCDGNTDIYISSFTYISREEFNRPFNVYNENNELIEYANEDEFYQKIYQEYLEDIK